MRIRIVLIICLMSIISFSVLSCKKFLDEKANQSLAVPESVDDLQFLLDNPGLYVGVELANTAADEYYVIFDDWQSVGEQFSFGYIWDPEFNDIQDWNVQYKTVFVAN